MQTIVTIMILIITTLKGVIEDPFIANPLQHAHSHGNGAKRGITCNTSV